MKYSFFISMFAISCLFSCDTPNTARIPQQKENEYKTFFAVRFKDIDSTATIDSFRFIRYDTLTLKNKYNVMTEYVANDMSGVTDEMKHVVKMYKTNAQIAALYSGLSGTLYRNYKSEAEDEMKKFKELQEKSLSIQRIYDSLVRLRDVADSISPLNYYAVCAYQVRFKDQTVKKDTAYLLTNIEKNLINREEYYKYQ